MNKNWKSVVSALVLVFSFALPAKGENTPGLEVWWFRPYLALENIKESSKFGGSSTEGIFTFEITDGNQTLEASGIRFGGESISVDRVKLSWTAKKVLVKNVAKVDLLGRHEIETFRVEEPNVEFHIESTQALTFRIPPSILVEFEVGASSNRLRLKDSKAVLEALQKNVDVALSDAKLAALFKYKFISKNPIAREGFKAWFQSEFTNLTKQIRARFREQLTLQFLETQLAKLAEGMPQMPIAEKMDFTLEYFPVALPLKTAPKPGTPPPPTFPAMRLVRTGSQPAWLSAEARKTIPHFDIFHRTNWVSVVLSPESVGESLRAAQPGLAKDDCTPQIGFWTVQNQHLAQIRLDGKTLALGAQLEITDLKPKLLGVVDSNRLAEWSPIKLVGGKTQNLSAPQTMVDPDLSGGIEKSFVRILAPNGLRGLDGKSRLEVGNEQRLRYLGELGPKKLPKDAGNAAAKSWQAASIEFLWEP